MIIGISSGITTNANARPVRMSVVGCAPPRRNSSIGMRMLKKTAINTRVLDNCFMDSCSGVFGSFDALVIPAILPSSVWMPVAVTTAFPRPLVTTVPAKTMFCCSLLLASAGKIKAASLAAGNDSPVNEDSSTSKPTEYRSLASAGTLCPGLRSNKSPGTMLMV